MIGDIRAIQIRQKQYKIYMQIKNNSAAPHHTNKELKTDKKNGYSTRENKKLNVHK